jgi:cold shock CspA family protein
MQRELTGTIKRVAVDKGFGFIGADGTDYFFHRSSCDDGTSFDQLQAGDRVRFEPVESRKGPRAEHVRQA